MSISVNINKLSKETIDVINDKLIIKIESESSGNFKPQPKIIHAFNEYGDDISLPFAFATNELSLNRRKRDIFPIMNQEFNGTLRPEQLVVKQEALQILSKKGSVILALATGFGKCLGINTPVLMFDGTIKLVQNIQVGDLLMGDDSKYRNVLSICRGKEQMYNIKQKNGDSFTCNESHILSLKFALHKKIQNKKNGSFEIIQLEKDYHLKKNIFYSKKEAEKFISNLNDDNEVIDISVKEYLKLQKSIKKLLKCYKVPINFSNQETPIDPYMFGYQLQKTDKFIPQIYKFNSKENQLKLLKGLIDNNKGSSRFEFLNKELITDIMFIIRCIGFTCYSNDNTIQIDYEKDSLTSSFKTIPIEEIDYYGFTIDGNHRFLLGDFTVTHNTITSIKLACEIKLKTLIIVNKIVLMKQWKEAINKVCPSAKIQIMSTKSEFDNDSNFYIMNAINISKMQNKFFSAIGCLIVDELHLIMAECLSKSLWLIKPRYLIGLSATPYRDDGFNPLIELFFGNDDQKIIRLLQRKHNVYKICTELKPIIEFSSNGKINWSSIIQQQSECEDRNIFILKIIQYFSKRNFLVLCKRVEQGNYLYNELKKKGENVTSLIGSQQEFDKEARILIGTTSKCGTGFDFPKLDTLLLASDIEQYYIQALGRILRRPDSNPLVLDLVDKNPILEKHFKTRCETYTNVGGSIQYFSQNEFLKFISES